MMKYRFHRLQTLADTLLLALTVLLPLKCGSMILPGVPHAWPDGVIGWLVTAPPPSFFVLAAGAVLALALLAYGVPETLSSRCDAGRLTMLWLALLPVGGLGLIDASSWEAGIVELEYVAGLGAFAGSLAIVSAARGADFRRALLNAAVAGVLLTAAVGVHQYFWGFDDLRAFVEAQEKLYGTALPADFKARIWDVRTYATFTFASALAGCLLLTGPAAVSVLWSWGGKFEPARLSRWLFAAGGTLVCGGVFLSTKGRGAFLAAVLAAALIGFLKLRKRKLQILLAVAALAVIVAGAGYIHYAGRGFGSMGERVGYLVTSAKMLAERPLYGAGWGDFTYRHALYKDFGSNELAKDPHNMLAAFAGQTGIAGGVLVCLLMVCPWYWALRSLRRDPSGVRWALFFGMSAFQLHVLMDLDWQVPGLMGLWIVTQFLLMGAPAADREVHAGRRGGRSGWWIGLVVCSVLALAGGVHWALGDWRLERLLNAAGLEVGAPARTVSSAAQVRRLADAALRVIPYSHSVYMALGNDALRRGNTVQAEASFRKALELAPESHLIYIRLGEVCEMRGEHGRAQQFYDEADRRFPYNKPFRIEQRNQRNSVSQIMELK